MGQMWQMGKSFKYVCLLGSVVGLCLPSLALADFHISDLPAQERPLEVMGHKHKHASRNASRDDLNDFFTMTPVPNVDTDVDDQDKLGGFNELLPFVMASPDQEDAGSCLYMAITGIAEWWLARLHPHISRAADGPLDLSERYIMNVAGMEEDDTQLSNWRTDSIYLFNRVGNKSLLNTAYRYTKGWFVGDTYSDHLTPVAEGTPKAEYGTQYNWIDQRPHHSQGIVSLPEFKRDVLFADPESNQWNVGVAPDNIADRVKESLRTRKAPVLVIYNHNSYWHAVYIIGYNDEMDNGKCQYTEHFRTVIAQRADDLARKAAEATDPTVKKAYEIRAKRAYEAKDKIETAYRVGGGCRSSKGVFYIRDSIYSDTNGPVYDYDLSRRGDEAPYAKKIVFKEYDWLRYFSNHVSVVYPK